MLERLEARVFGSVQGVGFRFFVQHEARQLQLTGLVQNLLDGSVEIIAEGEKEKLEVLLKRVSKGLPWARVKSISPVFLRATNAFVGFEKR